MSSKTPQNDEITYSHTILGHNTNQYQPDTPSPPPKRVTIYVFPQDVLKCLALSKINMLYDLKSPKC